MKITLTMDEEIVCILMDATEFYGRVLCGQYEEIARKVANIQYEWLRNRKEQETADTESSELWDRRNKAETAFLWPKKVQFPELEGIGHHHGLGYSRATDISYNVYQAVRYARKRIRLFRRTAKGNKGVSNKGIMSAYPSDKLSPGCGRISHECTFCRSSSAGQKELQLGLSMN